MTIGMETTHLERRSILYVLFLSVYTNGATGRQNRPEDVGSEARGGEVVGLKW